MRAARDHLKPGGVFSMYNYYRDDLALDRFANTLQSVFGHAPCVDMASDGGPREQAVLTVGRDPATSVAAPSRGPGRRGRARPPATDDQPFLYLQRRQRSRRSTSCHARR